jgi:hypothetical protein
MTTSHPAITPFAQGAAESLNDRFWHAASGASQLEARPDDTGISAWPTSWLASLDEQSRTENREGHANDASSL